MYVLGSLKLITYNSQYSRWEIHILVHVNIQERLYQWIAERSAIR